MLLYECLLQHDEAAKTSETAVILCSDVPSGRMVDHCFVVFIIDCTNNDYGYRSCCCRVS